LYFFLERVFKLEQIRWYLEDMLHYIIMMLPIYMLIRLGYILRKNKWKSVRFYREVGLLLFVLYLTGLASQTILPEIKVLNNQLYVIDIGFDPERINLEPFHKINETQILVENGHISYLFIEVFGNICLFIPIGFFLPILWKRFENFFLTVLICFGISLCIETIQLILPRGTDVDDIIMNTFGGAIGYILYTISKKNSVKKTPKKTS
jgi:glycopeptide antibiotics resistance protein